MSFKRFKLVGVTSVWWVAGWGGQDRGRRAAQACPTVTSHHYPRSQALCLPLSQHSPELVVEVVAALGADVDVVCVKHAAPEEAAQPALLPQRQVVPVRGWAGRGGGEAGTVRASLCAEGGCSLTSFSGCSSEQCTPAAGLARARSPAQQDFQPACLPALPTGAHLEEVKKSHTPSSPSSRSR
jgi:hypothetical protein